MAQRLRIPMDSGLGRPWYFLADPAASLTPGSVAASDRAWMPITVPAPWQSQDPQLRNYHGAGWYQCEFTVPAGWLEPDQRIILTFGAVDYRAEVWVNDCVTGNHEGGYLPFELDVTAAVHAGMNCLTVRVEDSPDDFVEIPHGKQSWYGMLSGIWQSVWLEARPALHITAVRVTPDRATGRLAVHVATNQRLPPNGELHCEILAPDGGVVSSANYCTLDFSLDIVAPQLWDIGTPNLYTLRVTLAPSCDQVETTFGFRSIKALDGCLLLNGRPLYLRAALDQDYYPALIATPPSYEYIEAEMRQALAMGFNCLRVHIKVADPRYYEAADRLGLLIWTELPNHAILTGAAARRARETIAGMVLRDWNHPSIIVWTIINEDWGLDITNPEHRAWLAAEYDALKALDSHRLIVDNSACWGNAHVVTDIEDFHNYYAMPDQFNRWRDWVAMFARRPWWSFAHLYRNYPEVKQFMKDPWHAAARPPAAENRRCGNEPLVISEFGNWGLPDLDQLLAGYGGKEPWWFETGHDWGDGVVYPHGIEERFSAYHLQRAFGSVKDLIAASQRLQTQAVKAEMEEMRRHATIQGYVVTEFTDVHWEANGMLDMHRNAKQIALALPRFNADDIVFGQIHRTAYYAGERVQVRLYLSHYSQRRLNGCRVQWELDDHPQVRGCFPVPEVEPGTVIELGTIRFAAPRVAAGMSSRIRFHLLTPEGNQLAHNDLELWFFPNRRQPPPEIRIYSDELSKPVVALGYKGVDRKEDAALVIANTMTDELREYMLGGGRVLWLAETKRARRTYLGGAGVTGRKDEVWEGNWASSLSWINRDQLFSRLPGDGAVDFMFHGLTPDYILTNFRAHEYATAVHAGLFVGWLHRTVPTIAWRRLGRGQFLACTFRLSKNLNRNPVADLMFDDMVAFLAKR